MQIFETIGQEMRSEKFAKVDPNWQKEQFYPKLLLFSRMGNIGRI